MEKKYYQIVAKTAEDWYIVHELLMQDGTLEDNIPSRPVECENEILHSPTRSTYLMTDEEAEILINDPRIDFVALDSNYHREAEPYIEKCISKYGRSVKNYRSLRKYSAGGSTSSFFPSTEIYQSTAIPPTGNYIGRESGEFYRTGYQILRSTQKNNPFLSDSSTPISQDINYLYDGTDVDVIVVDNGVFFGHPEFTYDEYTPPNYIRGNVLFRSGLCGVLDLALDSPYYLDPEWFDANPSARLERRWDGTLVPKETVALQWWASPVYRSASFPNFGSIVIDSAYSRALHCGANRTTSPSNEQHADHGTPCASLAYGKNFGWAFNANKWSIAAPISSLRGTPTLEAVYNIIKIFHTYKPNNPKFGTKNPTVTSNSYGSNDSIPSYEGYYSYQGGSAQLTSNLSSINFLKTAKSTNGYPAFYTPEILALFSVSGYASFALALQSGREMTDSGVISAFAAVNDGRYISDPTDPNWNNYYVDASGYTRYVNRPGYPSQIGYRTGESVYKTFLIGAIDDGYTGYYSSPAETNLTYLAAESGKEKLASNDGTYPNPSESSDYSNKGSGVDFYAAADGVLSAVSEVTQVKATNHSVFQNPYQLNSDYFHFDTVGNNSQASRTLYTIETNPFYYESPDSLKDGPSYTSGIAEIRQNNFKSRHGVTPINIRDSGVTSSSNAGTYTWSYPSVTFPVSGTYLIKAISDNTAKVTIGSLQFTNIGKLSNALDTEVFINAGVYNINIEYIQDNVGSIARGNETYFALNIDLKAQRFNDGYFNGTSAACPVAAGLLACTLQNNRDFTALQLKEYLKSNIENQTNFFTGTVPTSANDSAWLVPYSTMGTPVKIFYQFTTTTRTPNPTFTPSYGISSSERVNERFTITHNASNRNTLGIYGIQMFSSSISNGTSITLEIRNGYYLIGSNNRVNASGGPATDSDGTQFGRLDQIAIRVDPTNNKKVQLSDSNGADAWNNMEITVLNGTFQKIGTQIYYVYNGVTSSTTPTPVPASFSTATVPTISSATPGSIVSTGGGLSVSGEISAGGNIFAFVSDDRLKENQKCIENALDKVEKLNGFTYNFNETGEKIGFDPNKRHSGVSAQDVQEVLPEAVAPAPADNNYLTVKYDKLIPLLIESIKDLKNDIDDLKDNDIK